MKLQDGHMDTARALTHTPWKYVNHMVEHGSPGNVLEIGVCAGGSALALMQLVGGETNYIVTVDPWGNRPYETSGALYGDELQRGALSTLGHWAGHSNVNWHHFKLTSLEFLRHIQRLGCWYAGQHMEYTWDTVFLDGEHLIHVVWEELDLLAKHLKPGAVIFIDNANHAQQPALGGVNGKRDADSMSMDKAIEEWARRNVMDCTFLPIENGDLLAELRGRA